MRQTNFRSILIKFKLQLKMTPLHWAVEREHLEVMNVLLEHGADANATSKFDKTPISLALELHRLDLVDVLQQEREMLGVHAQHNQDQPTELDEATNSLMQLETERQERERFEMQQQQQQQQQQYQQQKRKLTQGNNQPGICSFHGSTNAAHYSNQCYIFRIISIKFYALHSSSSR